MFFEKIKAAYRVLGMAFRRQKWVEDVHHALRGVLGEYAKQRYAELAGFRDHDWTPEVRRLLRDLERYMDPGYIEIKGFWDRKKAFREAFRDAIPSQEIVRSAKNAIEKKLKAQDQIRFHKEVQKHFDEFDAETLLRKMLKDHAPKLYALVG